LQYFQKMIDQHQLPAHWGIHPVLLHIGKLEIDSYAFFVFLGLLAGGATYFILAKKMHTMGDRSVFIAVAALAGGVIGAKLPYWIGNYRQIIDSYPNIMPILSGRTITGGLIGGTIAVMWIKHRLKITEKRGNLFAPAVALGMAIGKLGCFFNGCCYGIPTDLPCGINLGDGIMRHPTQLYEIPLFLLFFFYSLPRVKSAPPGYLFFLLMNYYFVIRFFEEFIRQNSELYWGLSFFQYISIFALLFINIKQYVEHKTAPDGK